ncbi:MAG: hypothetical protein K2X87_14685 [Gemmataceae bacterium]|nr:hypothetical protein [Gemmataceae bacterium]
MTVRTRRRLLVVAGVVLVGVAAVAAPGLWARLFGPHVVTNALVGRTDGEIGREYGRPETDWDGYHRLGLKPPAGLPEGPIRTVIYSPRGLFHLEGGRLWVWLRRAGDGWVCFESCWFAGSVRF